MSSPGTGSDITPQEANDLLARLITESVKVQAIFAGRGGVSASVAGLVRVAPDGTLWVIERDEVGAPHIAFDPRIAVSRKYGDTRAFAPPDRGSFPGMPPLISAICFVFPDTSQLSLFEIGSSKA
jgi:hypothetical protein